MNDMRLTCQFSHMDLLYSIQVAFPGDDVVSKRIPLQSTNKQSFIIV